MSEKLRRPQTDLLRPLQGETARTSLSSMLPEMQDSQPLKVPAAARDRSETVALPTSTLMTTAQPQSVPVSSISGTAPLGNMELGALRTHSPSSANNVQSLAGVDDAPSHPATIDTKTSAQEEFVLAPQTANWEYHGFGSWLSVCSRAGLAWVSQRTGLDDFAHIAKALTSTTTLGLTMDRSWLPNGKSPTEIDEITAWRYVKAYFEDSIGALYGVVHKPEFEAELQAFFGGDETLKDDPAWNAIRKTIYAAGCRICLSKNSRMSFRDIRELSWSYFQDALSVLLELLFTPTSLLAVRALLAMTFFTEGLGCPLLEYMLCSHAVRLAQAKGLHRQPAKDWNVSGNELKHRNWLFWAIYCSEKGISHRAGRPSAIDDDEISCQIPTDTCSGSTLDVEGVTAAIRHAQISSRISKHLLSLKAFRQSPKTLLESMVDLDTRLRAWRESLPERYKPEEILTSGNQTKEEKSLASLLINLSYYGTLIKIHTIVAYPWIHRNLFGDDPSPAMQEQVQNSSNVIHQASRNILILVRGLEIRADCSQWGAFYYPMLAVINLFIHILKTPASPTTSSDMTLLDIAGGYFAHMDFVTDSDLSFPFARDVAVLARKTVEMAAFFDGVFGNAETSNVMISRAEDFPDDILFQADDTFNFDDWPTPGSNFTMPNL